MERQESFIGMQNAVEAGGPVRPEDAGSSAGMGWLGAFNDLAIGTKLAIGFMTLGVLVLLLVALIFGASRAATRDIDLTTELRVPAVLASARARSNLLRMQAAVRGYLVLGDLRYIDEYNNAKKAFEENLAALETLSADWSNEEDLRRLRLLQSTFAAWSPIPNTLFALHDNPIENQPAMRIENLVFRPVSDEWEAGVAQLIRLQEARPLTAQSRAVLSDLVDLQTSFQALTTNLRAYAITGDPGFKFGYADNLVANSEVFGRLREQRAGLSPEQQTLLDELTTTRRELLEIPLEIFAAQESERSVEDLYLFRTEVEPLAVEMLTLLDEITAAQQRYLAVDLARSRRSLAGMQYQTVVAGILALALGALMGLFFRNTIAGPVRRLDDTAKRIEGGDLAARAQIESKDEIGRLAMSFNEMTGRLGQTIDSLEQLATENRRLFEESQERAVELALAKEAAEDASRAKSRFLANVSHELRTPLNAVLGYTQILKRRGALHPEQNQAAQIIYENGIYLLTLINDLLDLSKIEASKLTLQPNYFELPRFLQNLSAIFQLRAAALEDVAFEVVLTTELPTQIRADEKRLRQILMNLLGNAFKFTHAGVIALRVGAYPEDGGPHDEGQPTRLSLEVVDTGIGMHTEQLERIFLPFEQAGDPGLQAQGTGLGLAIARDLAQAMGGAVTVQSEPGVGSTFAVTLTLPAIWEPHGEDAELGNLLGSAVFSSSGRPNASLSSQRLLKPPDHQALGALHDLAMKGELRNLRTLAQTIAEEQPQAQEYVRRVEVLADAFDGEAILELLEETLGR
jgi:signal transduction histidine kinase